LRAPVCVLLATITLKSIGMREAQGRYARKRPILATVT
jgi:hypothetical protein